MRKHAHRRHAAGRDAAAGRAGAGSAAHVSRGHARPRGGRAIPTPGRAAPHRLNRAEYANAIRDLLALSRSITSALLPPDDSADGFDNNADVLGVSPALLERYLSAAAKISALAVGSPAIGPVRRPIACAATRRRPSTSDGLPLGTRGGLLARHTFPLDGEYVIKVKLLETNLGSIRGLEDTHQLEITVDGERVLLAPVGGAARLRDGPSKNATDIVNSLDARLQVRVLVRAGQRPVGVAFLHGATALGGGTRLQPFDRSTLIATDHLGLPHVESMTITGPFNATGPGDTPSRRRVFTCRPAKPCLRRRSRACARDDRLRRWRAAPIGGRSTDVGPRAGCWRFYDAGHAGGRLRARHRAGAPRDAGQPQVRVPRRARSGRRRARATRRTG